jgi:hypothetical protein
MHNVHLLIQKLEFTIKLTLINLDKLYVLWY